MAFPTGSSKIPWQESEFERLKALILESVSEGGTIMDGCIRFEEETNGLRTKAANRYKWTTIIKPQCEDEYLQALEKGREAIAQRSLEGVKNPIRGRVAEIVRHGDDDESRMTQRELIRFLRTVQIVDEDVEQMKQELEQVRNELQEYKTKYEALKAEYDQMREEHDKLLDAFAIARKRFIDTPSSTTKVVVDKSGVVQSVKPENEE
ncbi:hypothetical protein GCM10025857_31820 [Alicyclobacillus contaminans]|uniref:PspA/IM30 family protein n=1 Tax=Alicyclobacillus contaminans TaxID=392016 RepID=UPI00041B5C38|nr:hypothetical protein [Alicyclobacillus contaminans]GMA51825.1 hypothetical protein GCM10025857_31820 [Alicyclobacillus contaminans]